MLDISLDLTDAQEIPQISRDRQHVHENADVMICERVEIDVV